MRSFPRASLPIERILRVALPELKSSKLMLHGTSPLVVPRTLDPIGCLFRVPTGLQRISEETHKKAAWDNHNCEKGEHHDRVQHLLQQHREAEPQEVG